MLRATQDTGFEPAVADCDATTADEGLASGAYSTTASHLTDVADCG